MDFAHGILIFYKIKYPIDSEGLCPPDPSFKDTITLHMKLHMYVHVQRVHN